MAEGKHTEGPWTLSGVRFKMNGHDFHHVNAEGVKGAEVSICSVYYDPKHHARDFANAKFIAAAPETAAERDRLKEINAELLAALIGLLPQTFTGAPDRKNEIAHWERERALGNGRAPLVLAAFAAISRATVTP